MTIEQRVNEVLTHLIQNTLVSRSTATNGPMLEGELAKLRADAAQGLAPLFLNATPGPSSLTPKLGEPIVLLTMFDYNKMIDGIRRSARIRGEEKTIKLLHELMTRSLPGPAPSLTCTGHTQEVETMLKEIAERLVPTAPKAEA